MDGIDSGGKIIIPERPLISESVKDKTGQGPGPQYYGRRHPPQEPQPEEETPVEPGKPKHLIDIKV